MRVEESLKHNFQQFRAIQNKKKEKYSKLASRSQRRFLGLRLIGKIPLRKIKTHMRNAVFRRWKSGVHELLISFSFTE